MSEIPGNLKKLNLWAALLHGGSFVGVLIIFLLLNEGKINFPTSLWRLQAKDLNNDNREFSSVDAKKQLEINDDFLKTSVLLTFALTCIAHIYYYTNGFGSGSYSNQLSQGKNNYRWFEYSITASFMILVLASISGVKDTKVYLILPFLNIVLQGIGYLSENTQDYNSKIMCLFIGFMLLGVTWYSIFSSFYEALDDAEKFPDTEGPPSWVRAIIIPMFVWWLTFGIVAFFQVKNYKNSNYSFITYEKWYIILSYLSKAFMGYYLAFGLTRPAPDRESDKN